MHISIIQGSRVCFCFILIYFLSEILVKWRADRNGRETHMRHVGNGSVEKKWSETRKVSVLCLFCCCCCCLVACFFLSIIWFDSNTKEKCCCKFVRVPRRVFKKRTIRRPCCISPAFCSSTPQPVICWMRPASSYRTCLHFCAPTSVTIHSRSS